MRAAREIAPQLLQIPQLLHIPQLLQIPLLLQISQHSVRGP